MVQRFQFSLKKLLGMTAGVAVTVAFVAAGLRDPTHGGIFGILAIASLGITVRAFSECAELGIAAVLADYLFSRCITAFHVRAGAARQFAGREGSRHKRDAPQTSPAIGWASLKM